MLLWTLRLLAVLFILAAPLQTNAQTGRWKALDTLFRGLQTGVQPGVAAAVVQNGQVVYQFTGGYANLEHRVPVTDSTRFNIASNAKQFTALAIWQLVQAGRIRLTDSLQQYVSDLRIRTPQPITIAHLVNHTSGIRDVYDLWSLQGKTWWQLFLTNQDALKLLRQQTELNFAPGSQYLYSNSNYLLLAEIIAKVTGKPFHAHMAEQFSMWNMTQTEFQSNYMRVIPNRARPYGNWNGWMEYPSVSSLHADGGLFNSLRDQIQWEIRLQTDSTLAATQRPVPRSEHPNYGWGLELGPYKGLPSVFHDGSTGAYNASLIRFPAQRISIVVLSNNGALSPNQLARRLADAVLHTQFPAVASATPKPTSNEIQPTAVTGRYRSAAGTWFGIRLVKDTLVRELPNRDPVRLLPIQGNLYRYANNPQLQIRFEVDRFTIFFPGQADNTAVRISRDVDVPRQVGQAFVGRYVNPETGATLEIVAPPNQQLTVILSGNQWTGQLMTSNVLVAGNYEMLRTPDGNLRLAGGRIQNVLFVRQ